MAKFVHSDVLDNGISGGIKSVATKMMLISAYAAGDSYATVTGNKLAEVTMTSADYTLSSSGNNRVLTVASGKSATATAASTGTPNLHIAFTDGSAKVLWVTDETTDQTFASGVTVNFPAPTYTSNQPT